MDDKAALELATRAAFRAGRIAKARSGDPGYLSWRGRRDVIVGSALEVQAAILAVLREEAPGDAILAEEGPEDEQISVDAERLWIVDPICGSLNFAMGIPLFAISIAWRSEGTLRVGVVYDPMHDEMFTGRVAEPAMLNGNHIAVKSIAFG